MLTFIAGSASDVFSDALAAAVESELQRRFPSLAMNGDDPYESEPLDPRGWRALQERMLRSAEPSPHVTHVDAWQAVYVPALFAEIEHVPIASAADPLQIASLPALIAELTRFAAGAALPTDDLELMRLAAHYLESLEDRDLDVQTYVQLMLSARQASARNLPLWVVV